MVEAVVTASIAAVAGCWSIVQGLHRRLNSLDNRQDRIELSMAKDRWSVEYAADQGKLEEHIFMYRKQA